MYKSSVEGVCFLNCGGLLFEVRGLVAEPEGSKNNK
jgi:hypothetical protein